MYSSVITPPYMLLITTGRTEAVEAVSFLQARSHPILPQYGESIGNYGVSVSEGGSATLRTTSALHGTRFASDVPQRSAQLCSWWMSSWKHPIKASRTPRPSRVESVATPALTCSSSWALQDSNL